MITHVNKVLSTSTKCPVCQGKLVVEIDSKGIKVECKDCGYSRIRMEKNDN